MKTPYVVLAVLLTSLLLFAGVNLADAQWSAIGSGFAVTTNYHGIDVPTAGLPVTATAGWAPELIPANNPAKKVVVKTVEFVWHYPDGTVAFTETVPILGSIVTPAVPPDPIPAELTEWANENHGITYWYAQSTQIPTVPGDWGVQAIFHNTMVVVCGKNSDTVRIRATSFNIVPEVPFGTIAILLSWIGVFGLFAVRKKHTLA